MRARSLASLAKATGAEAREAHVFVAACLRNLCKHSARFGREYVLEGGVKALAAMSTSDRYDRLNDLLFIFTPPH